MNLTEPELQDIIDMIHFNLTYVKSFEGLNLEQVIAKYIRDKKIDEILNVCTGQ